MTYSWCFLIRPNRVISQFLMALVGEKLSLGDGTKKSSLERQSQESFSSRAGTSIGRQKNPTRSPKIQSPNQERRGRRESFLFLVECKKIFSASQNYQKGSYFPLSYVLVAHNNFPPFSPNPVSSCQQCKRCKEFSFAVGFWMWISCHMTQQKKWRPILCTMRSSYIEKGFSIKKNTRRICSFAVGFFPECWAGHLIFRRLIFLLKKE